MTPQNFVTLPREDAEWALQMLSHYMGDLSCSSLESLRAALTEQVQPAQGEREQIIRKLKRDVQWVPGKHYVTQLEEIMDEAAALLQSNAERVPLCEAQWQEVAMLVGCEVIAPRGRAALSRIFGITKGQQ